MADPQPEPEIVVYPQDENTRFFFCCNCRTHIALFQEVNNFHFGKRFIHLKNLVNVKGDMDHLITNCKSIVRSVYCKTCNADLGFRLLTVHIEDNNVRAGSSLVEKRKLLIWYDGKEFDCLKIDAVFSV